MSLKQHNFRNVDHFANWVSAYRAGYMTWVCNPERLPYRKNFDRAMDMFDKARAEGYRSFKDDPEGKKALNSLRSLIVGLAKVGREHYAQDIKAEEKK
tara:strand:- start:1009 stop:1302 length:294 start_codon:yes stop_codon:yes gene_type:complete